MNSTVRVATAVAGVLVVGAIGLNLLAGAVQPGVGAVVTVSPVASPTPSVTSGPRADTSAVTGGLLPPGRYHIDLQTRHFATPDGSRSTRRSTVRVTFDVPAGWSGASTGRAIHKDDGEGADGRPAMAPWGIDSVYLDPCHSAGAQMGGDTSDPADVRTLDGLGEALAFRRGGRPISPTSPVATRGPIDVMFDGRDARYVTVITPALDMTECDGDEYTMWLDYDGSYGYSRTAGELNRLWIVEVPDTDRNTRGGLLVINTASQPTTSPADRAELQAIIDSMTIDLLPGS